MTNNLPSKIAIIAGQGTLPKELYEACQKANIKAEIVGLKDQVDEDLFKDIHLHQFPIHSVSAIINHIKSYGIEHIVLAGRVKRSSIPKLILDMKGAKLFTKIIRHGLSDKSLTITIVRFLEEEGFTLLTPEEISRDFLASEGNMTSLTISKKHMTDIQQGYKMLSDISQLDVGQALVIQNGLVLGVEAAEGTDELIKRCGLIRQKFDTEPVMVKICKTGQDKRVDMPCIGETTIKNMHKYHIKGIGLQAGSSIILNRKNTIELANKLGIFIYGLK